jgi:hypothetical protein
MDRPKSETATKYPSVQRHRMLTTSHQTKLGEVGIAVRNCESLRLELDTSRGAHSPPACTTLRGHPNAQTTNLPPTWTAGSDTPKKFRAWAPRKYEATIRIKLFKVTRHDSFLRFPGEIFRVSARKIGLELSGSTIGNSAPKTRKKL